uniref:Uncharacterized protein n=1 Tax=Anopheles farauti TaxID=69004 RepID=A0A182PZE8_9DIPT
MRTRLASLIVVKQEPSSSSSSPPPQPSLFSSPSSSCSSSSSSSLSSSSSSPPSSLFRSSLVVADGCDGPAQCYGTAGGAIEVNNNRNTIHDAYYCPRNGHGYGAPADGFGGDLNNNDPAPSNEFEFFDEKKFR